MQLNYVPDLEDNARRSEIEVTYLFIHTKLKDFTL